MPKKANLLQGHDKVRSILATLARAIENEDGDPDEVLQLLDTRKPGVLKAMPTLGWLLSQLAPRPLRSLLLQIGCTRIARHIDTPNFPGVDPEIDFNDVTLVAIEEDCWSRDEAIEHLRQRGYHPATLSKSLLRVRSSPPKDDLYSVALLGQLRLPTAEQLRNCTRQVITLARFRDGAVEAGLQEASGWFYQGTYVPCRPLPAAAPTQP